MSSTKVLHDWLESAKLAFADREASYGDPLFDPAPFDVLLSAPYTAARRVLIGQHASLEMRPLPDEKHWTTLSRSRVGMSMVSYRLDIQDDPTADRGLRNKDDNVWICNSTVKLVS